MRRGEEELELKFLSLETNLALFQTGVKNVKLQAMSGSQYTTNSLRLLKCTSYRIYQVSDTLPNEYQNCYFTYYAIPVYYYQPKASKMHKLHAMSGSRYTIYKLPMNKRIVKLQAMPGSQYTTNSLRLLKCTSYRLYQIQCQMNTRTVTLHPLPDNRYTNSLSLLKCIYYRLLHAPGTLQIACDYKNWHVTLHYRPKTIR